MTILSNIHTHTTYCDGKLPAKEMVERAVELRFVSIGFSAHSPLPYKNDYAMALDKQEAYISEINRLKKLYNNKVEVILGLELDLDSMTDTSPYSYIIGAVHQFHDGGKVYAIDYNKETLLSCIQNVFSGDSLLMAEQYYKLVEKCAEKQEVSVVAHYDLISKFNDDGLIFDEYDKRYIEIAISSLNRICGLRPELVFEINTGAMYRLGNRRPYPAPFILSYLNARNVRIMINSDAHDAAGLDFGFQAAIDLCKQCGVRSVYRMREMGFEEIKIN